MTDKIGKYDIVEKLGQGGMGIVYRGFDPELQREVAIKVLGDDLSHRTSVRKRFLQEARLAAGLRHENITTIHDLGQDDDGHPFIVMEYLTGVDLSDALRSGRLTNIRQKLEIARQICNGLEVAHEQNIVHRDIKPANIFLQSNGKIKILDFGIAKSLSIDVTSGLTVGTIGTVHYMSPEQVDGKTIDTRSDIFSFGVLLYELMSGEKPFPGEGAATIMYRIVHAAPEPLAPERIREVPAVANIILRCLQKDADKRYQRMSEVHEDITSLLRNKPVTHAGDMTSDETRVMKEDTESMTEVRPVSNSGAQTAPMPAVASGGGSGKWIGAVAGLLLVTAIGWWQFGAADNQLDDDQVTTEAVQHTEQTTDDNIGADLRTPNTPPEEAKEPKNNELAQGSQNQKASFTQPPIDKRPKEQVTKTPVTKGTKPKASKPTVASNSKPSDTDSKTSPNDLLLSRANEMMMKLTESKQKSQLAKAVSFAPEALNEANLFETKGNDLMQQKEYQRATALLETATTWYDRSTGEAKSTNSAESLYGKRDYKEALAVLDTMFSGADYQVENIRAHQLRQKINKDYQRVLSAITAAESRVQSGDLGGALAALDALPTELRDAGDVQKVRSDVQSRDTEPPQISASTLKQYNHRKSLKITARVEDNLSVKAVWLYYKKKNEDDFSRLAMRQSSGDEYYAQIDPGSHNGREIHYYFSAEDDQGNEGKLLKDKKNPFKVKRKERHSVPVVP